MFRLYSLTGLHFKTNEIPVSVFKNKVNFLSHPISEMIEAPFPTKICQRYQLLIYPCFDQITH